MRFAFSDIQKFLTGSFSCQDLVNGIESIGLEVDYIHEPCYGFIICKIIESFPHTNASKLKVCIVDSGEKHGLKQIVCGASNVTVGMFTVLACEGAILPVEKSKISKVSLRSVESFGMLCSEKELGLISSDCDGIIDLDDNWLVGESFFLDDHVLEVSITPNRGDLISVLGLAKELAAFGLGELREVDECKFEGAFTFPYIINNLKPDQAVFGSCCFRGLSNAKSPKWLQQKLQLLGCKAQSALIDITNFFNLCFSRPMHVYDADLLQSNMIEISESRGGESFLALNGKKFTFGPGLTVVKNGTQIVSLLGIIGSEDSKCSLNTSSVLLEVVFVDPKLLLRSRRKVCISNGATYVFERRGAHLGQLRFFLEWAANLITEICGGEASDIVVSGNSNDYVKEFFLDWKPQLINEILGTDIDVLVIRTTLQKLGFIVVGNKIQVPEWRLANVENHNDLAEAFIRVYGYEKIPEKNFAICNNAVPVGDFHSYDLESLARSRGMVEVMTWSFMHSKKLLIDCGDSIKLTNPVNNFLDVMRNSVIPNLLDVAHFNIDRGEADIAIFESGNVYVDGEEKLLITGLRVGMSAQRNIYGLRHSYDFFDVKADVIAVLAEYGFCEEDLRFVDDNLPGYYHPGKAAHVYLKDESVAFCGVLMPSITKHINGEVSVFEIFKYVLANKEKSKTQFKQSVYQKVKRDFAFICANGLKIQSLIDLVYSINDRLIRKVYLFDVYSVDEKHESIAICVVIQADDRTLTTEEIQQVSDGIIYAVESQLGAKLRDKD